MEKRKLERLVQLLYFALITVLFLGAIFHNSVPLIPPVIRNILLTLTSLGILVCLAQYYFFSKKQ